MLTDSSPSTGQQKRISHPSTSIYKTQDRPPRSHDYAVFAINLLRPIQDTRRIQKGQSDVFWHLTSCCILPQGWHSRVLLSPQAWHLLPPMLCGLYNPLRRLPFWLRRTDSHCETLPPHIPSSPELRLQSRDSRARFPPSPFPQTVLPHTYHLPNQTIMA